MNRGQLRLFPAPQPLVERLGAEWFRDVPRAPGIYRMFDDADRLIYVGKARDLRARLDSYRRTHGQSGRICRLIHTARRIEFEVLPSETAAALRENDLIRSLRPKFNRAGTWPKSARFVHWTESDSAIRLELTSDPTGECFGAFRGPTARGLVALARLDHFAVGRTSRLEDLPRPLLMSDSLRTWNFPDPPHPEEALERRRDLRAFLNGDDDRLVALWMERIPEPVTAFEALFLAAEFEAIESFHRRGPHRNARLRRLAGPDRTRLSPEELDDLALLDTARPPGFRGLDPVAPDPSRQPALNLSPVTS